MTVTLQYRKLCAIQYKTKSGLTSVICLLHDNAHIRTKTLLKKFKWEILSYPPYSPKVATCNFQIFPYLKRQIAGQSLHDDDKIKTKL